MAKREITVGSTDQTIDVFIQDSSSTTGAGLSGLVYNTASLACYYRKGATGSATQLSLATQTVGGAHSDGGFVEIQATNMKGVYRLDLSDTMVAAAGMLTIMLYGATNMAPVVAEIEVVAVDKFDAVRGGMTALPNANADAAGGLPISDAGGLDLDAKIGALTYGTANRVNAQVYGIENNAITAASINADAITDAKVASDVTIASVTGAVGSVTGAVGSVTGNVGGNVTGTVASVVGNVGGNVTGSVGSVVGAVGSVTGNVGGSVASVVGAVGSVTGNVGGNVAGSVGSVTGNVGGSVASVTDKAGFKLASDGADLVMVDGKSLPAALQIIAAICAGKISGAGTGTEVFVGLDGSTTRVTVTVDSSGNRSVMVYS